MMFTTETKNVKPILKYPGGKTRELKTIQRYIPHGIENYYEPFLGGGAVWLSVNAKRYYVNDISTELIDLYRYIKHKNQSFIYSVYAISSAWDGCSDIAFSLSSGSFLIKPNMVEFDHFVKTLSKKMQYLLDAYPLTDVHGYKQYANLLKISLEQKVKQLARIASKGVPISNLPENLVGAVKNSLYLFNRSVYNSINNNTELKIALYWFLREFCYSSMFRFNLRGEFNVPYGGNSYNSKSLADKLRRVHDIDMMDKMDSTVFSSLDFQAALKTDCIKPKDFIFLDPPYDTEFSTYNQIAFTNYDQERLAEHLINAVAGKFLLVIQQSELIECLYKKGAQTANGRQLDILCFDKTYSVSFMDRNNRAAKHMLIANYPLQGSC